MSPDRELVRLLKAAEDDEHTALQRRLCELILVTTPDHGPTLIRYARVLIELAQYEDADLVLKLADDATPTNRRHLVAAMRGHLMEHQGDFIAAEQQHLLAHELDPEDATYLIYAASVAFRRGDVSRAEELGRQAVACPEGCLDEAYSNLGGYLLSQQRFAEARECYLRALIIDPNYSIAQIRLRDVQRVLELNEEYSNGTKG